MDIVRILEFYQINYLEVQKKTWACCHLIGFHQTFSSFRRIKKEWGKERGEPINEEVNFSWKVDGKTFFKLFFLWDDTYWHWFIHSWKRTCSKIIKFQDQKEIIIFENVITLFFKDSPSFKQIIKRKRAVYVQNKSKTERTFLDSSKNHSKYWNCWVDSDSWMELFRRCVYYSHKYRHIRMGYHFIIKNNCLILAVSDRLLLSNYDL